MASPQAPLPHRRRLRLSVGAAVVLALVVLSAAVGVGILRGQSAPVETVSLTDTGTDTGAGAGASPGLSSTGELYVHVHVLGSVERPGLYVLDLDARVVDAVAAAGGTTTDADLSAVNLARVVEDGEQIVVPATGAMTDAPGGAAAPPGDARIDLNTADQAALETLPRIGPALAERIVAWREENGRFASIDDLLAVPGIGEKLLEGLRDGVRV
ncbi:ComEA family DNA-binding protein [Microbacterium oxydans]|uniref:ComEA family DNA-binding protein n=1 Tax=Microbacterium oxydans TaxID=82380 RepID=UPI0036724A14